MADDQLKKPTFATLFKRLVHSVAELAHVLEGKGTDGGGGPADDTFEPQEPSAQHLLQAPTPHSEAAQLLTQATPGWHKPQPSALAGPSYAPAMTAFGIVFLALGAVTVWPLSVVGAFIFLLAIAKWIGELLHD